MHFLLSWLRLLNGWITLYTERDLLALDRYCFYSTNKGLRISLKMEEISGVKSRLKIKLAEIHKNLRLEDE